MLSNYCRNVLKAELLKNAYDNMSADEAWTWLMVGEETSEEVPTGALLSPNLGAAVLGPIKANLLASKIHAAIPAIADNLMNEGVSLSSEVTIAFLNAMVGDGITQDDVDALIALGTKTVTHTSQPRFDNRFTAALWPNVKDDGTIGGNKPITGFPNTLEREDFDSVWSEVR